MWEETHPAPVRGTNDGRDFAVTTERRGVLGGFLRGGETVSGRGRCPEAPGNPAAGRRVCGRRFRARTGLLPAASSRSPVYPSRPDRPDVCVRVQVRFQAETPESGVGVLCWRRSGGDLGRSSVVSLSLRGERKRGARPAGGTMSDRGGSRGSAPAP